MPNGGEDSDDNWQSRRQYLKLTSTAAGAGLIAGCGGGGSDGGDGDGGGGSDGGDGDGSGGSDGGDGDGGGGSDGGDGGGGNQPAKEEFVARLKGIFPTDAQFNPFNPKNGAWQINNIIYDSLVFWDAEQKYWPQIARSWSVPDAPEEGSKVTITLRDDPAHTWHNGDPVVAQDVVTSNLLGKEFGNTIWDYISDASVKDEYTVEYTINQTINPQILKSVVLKQGVQQVKHSLYKENLQQIQDATSESKTNEAVKTLQNRVVGRDEVIGNGPYRPVDATSKKFFCERYEDYEAVAENDGVDSINSVDYDIPNFPKYTFLFASEDQALPLFKSEKLDGSRTGQIVPADLPSSYTVRSFLNDLGESFGFNLQHDIFGRRNVRKAMAHIVNRETVVKSMKPNISGEQLKVETPNSLTGMADPHAREWLGDDYDAVPKYNNGKNTEMHLQRATELLEEEGFSKQKGEWIRPNGEVWTPELKTPSFWEKSMSPTVNLLKRFGIKASLTVQDSGVFYGTTIPNGDFGGIGFIWISQGGSLMSHPWNAYVNELKSRTVKEDTQDGALRIPREVEIPGTIGDPSSSMETVDIPQLVTDLSKPLPDDEMQRKVKRAAWTFNQLMTNIQLRRFATQQAIDPANFVWPEQGSRLDKTLLWYSFNVNHGGFRAKWQSEM